MKDVLSIDEAREKFTEYLEVNKCRKTTERFAILECLYMHEGHYCVDDIYEMLQYKYRVSKATVYNTLEHLCKANLVLRNVFDGNTNAYYERFTLRPHHHAICLKCGSISNWYDDEVVSLLQAKKIRNFRMQETSLQLYGKCIRCKVTKQDKSKQA